MRARTGCPAQGAGPRPPVCRGNGAPKAQGEGRGRPVCPCWGHGATAFHGEELPNPSARHPAGVRSGLPRKQPPRPLCPETRPQDSSPGSAEPQRLTRHRADEGQGNSTRRATPAAHRTPERGGLGARRTAHTGLGHRGCGQARPRRCPHPTPHTCTRSHTHAHTSAGEGRGRPAVPDVRTSLCLGISQAVPGTARSGKSFTSPTSLKGCPPCLKVSLYRSRTGSWVRTDGDSVGATDQPRGKAPCPAVTKALCVHVNRTQVRAPPTMTGRPGQAPGDYTYRENRARDLGGRAHCAFPGAHCSAQRPAQAGRRAPPFQRTTRTGEGVPLPRLPVKRIWSQGVFQ